MTDPTVSSPNDKATKRVHTALYASLASLGAALLLIAILLVLGPQAWALERPLLFTAVTLVVWGLGALALLVSLWGLAAARFRSIPLLLIALCALTVLLSLVWGA